MLSAGSFLNTPESKRGEEKEALLTLEHSLKGVCWQRRPINGLIQIAVMVSSLLNKKLKLLKKAARKQRFIKIITEVKVIKTICIPPRPSKACGQ